MLEAKAVAAAGIVAVAVQSCEVNPDYRNDIASGLQNASPEAAIEIYKLDEDARACAYDDWFNSNDSDCGPDAVNQYAALFASSDLSEMHDLRRNFWVKKFAIRKSNDESFIRKKVEKASSSDDLVELWISYITGQCTRPSSNRVARSLDQCVAAWEDHLDNNPFASNSIDEQYEEFLELHNDCANMLSNAIKFCKSTNCEKNSRKKRQAVDCDECIQAEYNNFCAWMSEDVRSPFVNWDDSCDLPDMRPCGCQYQSDDSNGRYFFEHVPNGGKAMFQCNPGYVAVHKVSGQSNNQVISDIAIETCAYDFDSDTCQQPQANNYKCVPKFCTNPPQFPGFVAKADQIIFQDYWRIGDTLQLDCLSGTCGTAVTICKLDSNGQTASWSHVSAGICAPSVCRPQAPQYGTITEELIDNGVYYRITCEPGFYAEQNGANVGLSADVLCEANPSITYPNLLDPQWIGIPHDQIPIACESSHDHGVTCKRVVCDSPPDIPGFITPADIPGGNFINLEVEYMCGDETCGSVVSTCMMDSDGATASWSYINSAICRPKACEIPENFLPNGIYDRFTDGRNQIQFRCNPGYLAYVDGHNHNSAKYYLECDTDENDPSCRQVQRPDVECRRITCGAPPKYMGFMDLAHDPSLSYEIGATVTYTCDTHSCGQATSRCQLNEDAISASWTRIKSEICVAKSCYVTAQSNGSDSIDFITDGSSAVQICNTGFHTRRLSNSYETSERYFCNTMESLNPCNDPNGACCRVEISSVPCFEDTCEQRCSIDTPDNAQVYSDTFDEGVTMQIHCNAGFVAHDNNVSLNSRTATVACTIPGGNNNCLVNIPHQITCVPVSCGAPINFDGFQAFEMSGSLNSGGNWLVDSTAFYVCDTQHCGQGISRCNLNPDGISASWTFLSSGCCVPKRCSVAALTGGAAGINGILNNDIVIQSCDDGKVFQNSDGVISSSVSTLCDTSSDNTSCDDADGACCNIDLSQPAICEIPPQEPCEKTCTYEAPDNGVIHEPVIRDREEFVITCYPGFVVWCDGVNQRSATYRKTCLVDHTDPTCAQPMSHHVECRPVECEDPPKFFGFQFVSGTQKFQAGVDANSAIIGTQLNGNQVFYNAHGHWCVGDTATYQCTRNRCGTATTRCTLNIDKITATWTPISSLICQPKTCRLPKLVNGSGLINGISNGLTSIQTCNAGYRMTGYALGDTTLARSATIDCDTSVDTRVCADVTDGCCVVDLEPQYACEPNPEEPQCLIRSPKFGSVPSSTVDVGSEFVVTCDPGFLAYYNGTNTNSRSYHVSNIQQPFTNQTHLEYDYNQICEHLVTCNPVACPNPPTFIGFQDTTSQITTEWNYWTPGETAQYICNQDTCGGAISTCELNNDGISASWTYISDNLCAEKRCVITPPKNGQVSSYTAQDGQTYKVTCDVGYVAHVNGVSQNANYAHATCDTLAVDNACRTVVDHTITCECVMCPALPTFPGLERKDNVVTDEQLRTYTWNGQPIVGFTADFYCPTDSCGCATTQCILNEDGITASWTPINDDQCVKKTCHIDPLAGGENAEGIQLLEHGHTATQYCQIDRYIHDLTHGARTYSTVTCDITNSNTRCDDPEGACCSVEIAQNEACVEFP